MPPSPPQDPQPRPPTKSNPRKPSLADLKSQGMIGRPMVMTKKRSRTASLKENGGLAGMGFERRREKGKEREREKEREMEEKEKEKEKIGLSQQRVVQPLIQMKKTRSRFGANIGMYEPPTAQACFVSKSTLSSSMIRYCSSCHLSTTSHPSPGSTCPAHQTIFIRCAGYCSSDHSLIPHSERVGGVGVFFGLYSERNISESVPREISLAHGPLLPQEMTTDRMDLWSAIRAIDRVLELVRGGENIGWKKGRPSKVAKGLKEVVVMMESEYVINGMLLEGDKPWDPPAPSTPPEPAPANGVEPIPAEGKTVRMAPTPLAAHDPNLPTPALTPVPTPKPRRTWFGLRRAPPPTPSPIVTLVEEANASPAARRQRKAVRISPRDHDLFCELEEMCFELDREGIEVLFWRIMGDHHGGAGRLAKEGAVKPKIYG